ncbi:MAG: hypothetical protein JSS76_02105 [Bacteroidetes bacterium]|nr:hypothetical protein [Bacteroidota bacterium]
MKYDNRTYKWPILIPQKYLIRIGIIWQWVVCRFASFLGRKMSVYYVTLADPYVISSLTTLIWDCTYCYKIVLPDGSIVSPRDRACAIKIDNNQAKLAILFYGIDEVVEKVIPINQDSVSTANIAVEATNHLYPLVHRVPDLTPVALGMDITMPKLQILLETPKVRTKKIKISLSQFTDNLNQ